MTYAKLFVKTSVSLGKIMMADDETLSTKCLFKFMRNKGHHKMETGLRSHTFHKVNRDASPLHLFGRVRSMTGAEYSLSLAKTVVLTPQVVLHSL